MDRGRAATALLALAACIVCSYAAPTTNDQTALEVPEGPSNGCYYNFQHYGEGDRIMTNEPCLNCTCHNRMLMCYLRVCPFTKPIGQDCTIEKRADQCCPIVTCPDVPVDLLTSTSTSSPAEYGTTGLGKLDKYGCSINGKYFPEGAKVPPTPNKPCEHCYCIRNMTTCVMQECTLHVDGCTPIYHKDVCCPVRYSCDHPEDEIPLLDDMTTTVRPTPGFLLTTTMSPVTQPSQDCVHDDQIFADGAHIKTENACEHCYCMKGDLVCVVQACGTPMENEGKNCTSLPPRQGQCCPDTYICEGDEASTDLSTEPQELTTVPPRRVAIEGSGYRNEPDEPYTEIPQFEIGSEGSGEEYLPTSPIVESTLLEKETPEITETPTILDIISESSTSTESHKIQETSPDISAVEDAEKFSDVITTEASVVSDKINIITTVADSSSVMDEKEKHELTTAVNISPLEDIFTQETPHIDKGEVTTEVEKTTKEDDILDEVTLKEDNLVPTKEYHITTQTDEDIKTMLSQVSSTSPSLDTTQSVESITPEIETQTSTYDLGSDLYTSTPKERLDSIDTTSINPIENEIHESDSSIFSPGRIPGEGDCLLNSITYENNSIVPSTNNCHTSCRCVSSIIKCDPIICSAPPEYMNDCQPIYDSPESCCPTYVCSTKETVPPKSHNQMSETGITKPVSASECNSPDCLQLENKPDVSGCTNDECTNKDKISQEPCDGDECKLDLPHDKQPDIQGEPACTEENGCIKPIEVHTQGECQDNNCKTEPVIECSGSDCAHEVTTPSLSGSTYHETPIDELTVIPVTNKVEIEHDFVNTELPTERIHVDKEPNTSTETSEIYVTIPIKSSTVKSEIETSHTEIPQSPEMDHNKDITKLPDEHITPTEISDINITDSPLIETQTNTMETYHPEHETTESDYSNEVIQHTLSDHKHSTVGEVDIQKTTTTPHQITSEINEQPVTEIYEIKSEEPMTFIQEEVQHTLSPEIESPIATTTIVTDDSHELINRLENVDSITDHLDKELVTTENIIPETVTSLDHTVHEYLDVATTKPNIDSVLEDTVTDKVIENVAMHTLSPNKDDITSESVTEHQINIKLDENYTQSPMPTASEIEVTDISHTSSEHELESGEYKPISESTYAPNANEQEVNENRITNVPEINTELPLIEQTNLDEQHIYVTDKVEINLKEKDEPEIIKEPVEVSSDEDKNTYLQTTESVNAETKPTEESKTTDAQHTSVVPLIDGENEDLSSDKMSTIKEIDTDVYATTESIGSEEKLYTSSPVSTTIRDTEIDNSVQDLHEAEKKTTTYPVYDSKLDFTISSNELTNSEFSPNTEKESILDLTTEIPERGVQEIYTEKIPGELPHTHVIDSFEQHDAYTTETGQESSEPIMTTNVPTYTENKTPLTEDETLNIGEDNLASDKQDSISSSTITQKEPMVSVELTTSPGETTANTALETKTSESESPFTTVNVKDIYPSEHEAVTQITTKIPSLESMTTHKYEDIDTTVSIIDDRGDDGLSIGTKSDIEVNTEKIESSTKLEGITIIQETSTDHKIPVEVDIPHEFSTEEPINEIKVQTSEIPEFNTMISENIDVTTTIATVIDMKTKLPEITSIKYSDPAFTTLKPGESEFTNVPTFEVDEHKPKDKEYQTTPQTSDLNVEVTTAKEVITSIDILQNTLPSIYEEEKTTAIPVDINMSNIQDFNLDTTNLSKTTDSSPDINLQNTTPLEEIPDKKETTAEFIDTTPRDSTISEIESSTVIKVPDAIAHEEDKLDTQSVDEYGLQTSRPDMSQSEPTTEKDLQQSVLGETTVEQDIQQNEVPLEISTVTPLLEETIVTSIPSENLSSPDISLSLVTNKFEAEHETPLPVSSPSTQSSKQEESIVTTESSESHIDRGSSSTEKSPINEPEISSTIIAEPIDINQSDIKTTSSDENIYRTESSKQPEYITEQPDKITTQQASEVSQSSENNNELQPSVTEKEKILDTEVPDSSLQPIHGDEQYDLTTMTIPEMEGEKVIEEQPVTKESISNNEEYEKTTPAFLEKEVEKELETKPATKEPSPNDDNQPTSPTFVDKEIEKDEIVTETVIPDIGSHETTTTVLREKDSENEIENQKVTKQPNILPTLYVTTTISPDTITTKEFEDQTSSEQSGATKDHYETSTSTSIEKITEKEIESPSILEQHIPASDVSATTASVLLETETEKEVMTVSLENKDVFETTTLVMAEKEKDIESHSVTEESPNNDLFEITTAKLGVETTKASISSNDLYESTTLHLSEKEKENEISPTTQLLGSSSESSVIPSLEAEATTTTYKIPDTGDDTERSTETVIKYSETTPYLIELQEHTHQSIDETSSKMPIEQDSTTEQYISEQPNRGDIPIKDDVNLLPTTYDEDMLLTSPKEGSYSTTPTSLSTDREPSVHNEVTTEIDLAVSQLPSEAPKEDEQIPVISETEKPSSQTSDSGSYTEKHIDEDVTHKPEISDETMVPAEEVTKSTTHSTSAKPSEESTIHTEEFDKPEEKPVETEPSAEVAKPELNEPVSDDLPSPDFPPSGAGGYGQEPDYGDSEDQAFGPGTCRYGGKVYVSAQQIPRDDPCDFCFCFRSDIICLQQSCPPPIHGCHEEPIQGFCCPRYECPVSMATTLNVTTTTTTTTTTLPPHFLPHAYKGAAQRRGCQIKGHTYKVGEVVRASSGPCLHCTCGGDGQMKCDPKACTPEPMLRQMIAAAVSAKRRR